MTEPRPLVAGATGYTGKRLLPLIAEWHPISWQRTGSHSPQPSTGTVISCGEDDGDILAEAMRGCTTVVQLIGTTRAQFGTGNNYERADIGTTRLLVDAAVQATTITRFVLLSSVGAGRPVGAYLKAKKKAEAIVRYGGIQSVLVRPSSIIGPGREAARLMAWVTPKNTAMGSCFHPIHVDRLAALLAWAIQVPLTLPVTIWEGRALWAALADAESV